MMVAKGMDSVRYLMTTKAGSVSKDRDPFDLARYWRQRALLKRFARRANFFSTELLGSVTAIQAFQLETPIPQTEQHAAQTDRAFLSH